MSNSIDDDTTVTDDLPAIPGKRYFTIGEVSELCSAIAEAGFHTRNHNDKPSEFPEKRFLYKRSR